MSRLQDFIIITKKNGFDAYTFYNEFYDIYMSIENNDMYRFSFSIHLEDYKGFEPDFRILIPKQKDREKYTSKTLLFAEFLDYKIIENGKKKKIEF